MRMHEDNEALISDAAVLQQMLMDEGLGGPLGSNCMDRRAIAACRREGGRQMAGPEDPTWLLAGNKFATPLEGEQASSLAERLVFKKIAILRNSAKSG